jgi:hypothetical protein
MKIYWKRLLICYLVSSVIAATVSVGISNALRLDEGTSFVVGMALGFLAMTATVVIAIKKSYL